MPWSNQGGGGGNNPWGGAGGGGSNGSGGGNGGGNPWGGGGSGGGGGRGRGPGGGGFGGGPTPPDLEETVRKFQDRAKRMMPGGLPGRGGVLIGILVVALIWVFNSVYTVQPDQQGVVLRFGEHVRTTNPGLQLKIFPIETVLLPSVTTINRVEVGFSTIGAGQRDAPEESIMLTSDEALVDIDFTVLWRISQAEDYLFNIRDQEQTIKRVAESAMREVIARYPIEPILTVQKDLIQQEVRESMQNTLNEFQAGVEITEVQFQEVNPPSAVVDAFNEVQRAEQDRDRLRNQAEAYRNDIIPRARGEAERMIQEASAYREQVVNRAQGSADRFLSVLEAYRTAPEVTARRLYLETMEEVLANTNKVIIDSEEGAGQGVVPYLPLNELRRSN